MGMFMVQVFVIKLFDKVCMPECLTSIFNSNNKIKKSNDFYLFSFTFRNGSDMPLPCIRKKKFVEKFLRPSEF